VGWSRRLQAAAEWVALFAVALTIALLVRGYVVEARRIPTESMIPTIMPGDQVLVEKVSYRFREVHRGDIIVFHPVKASDRPSVDLIKRVIGLPGDRIQIRQGIVFINAVAVTEPYINNVGAAQPPSGPPSSFSAGPAVIENFGPVTIDANSLFVMGDNRNNSCDSRFWGTVPRANVVGRAFAIYYPFDRLTSLSGSPLVERTP